jgi:hypothetical protein
MATTYSDDQIEVSADLLKIRSRFKTSEIPLADIRSARLIELGIERYRLVGIGPTRLRTWFVTNPNRRRRSHEIELDVGRLFRIGISAEDPQAALDAITKNADLNQGETR